MFGKNRSNDQESSRRKGADLMNQMGFGGIGGMPDFGDDDDEDLEAELAELTGVDHKPAKTKAKGKAPMPLANIEKMAAVGMEDIDDNVSDTEDPSLLAELEDLQEDEDEDESPPPSKAKIPSPLGPKSPPSNLTFQPSSAPPARQVNSTPSPAPRTSPAPAPSPASAPKPSISGGMPGLLEDRLNMYKQASANAKAAGDSSKQRRLDRGIKTLVGLLRQAKAGKAINEDEIPPPVAMGTRQGAASGSSSSTPESVQTPPSQSTPETQPQQPPAPPRQENTGNTREMLMERRDQYKKSALMAKRAGDMAKAGSYVKTARQFDNVIKAIEEGQPVDLSQMPPPPPEFGGKPSSVTSSKPQPTVPVERSANQATGSKEPSESDMVFPTATEEDVKKLFNSPDAPKTVLEALTQRLTKYQTTADNAKKAGEGSKARRMGRIVKQYEDAIKSYKAGRQVDFDELPTPPGFAPIPVNQAPPQPQKPQASPTPTPAEARVPAPAPRTQEASKSPQPSQPGHSVSPSGSGVIAKKPVQRQASKKITSRTEQQLAFLKERLGEFKQAALAAKKNQDIELAKNYIRIMKGIEPMIEAVESGLPVDLTQVPQSPLMAESEDKFVVVNAEDCEPSGDREEVFQNLQKDLIKQIQICVTNAQHYQKLGDVPAAARFQKLEQGCRKDVESLKSSYRHGDPAPRFHYEVRSFSMVQSNTDLGDADMEVTIVRGIQYNLPSGYAEKDMDTFVKYELAYPTDDSQTGSTGTVKDTINPEYKESFKLQINRASKAFCRFIERKALKLEIYYKRGFFKGDKLLGSVNVKLNNLERKCILHESYDLMDGRKSAGGKLEVKIRIRDPFKQKQVEEVKEKWLVIDQFVRTIGSKSQAEAKAPKSDSGGSSSMEVLRYEKQLLDKQISQLKDSLSVNQTHSLRQRSTLIQEKIELQQKKLREGGMEAWKAYLAAVTQDKHKFEQEARQYIQIGDVSKAEIFMNKRKYADKEITAIKAKLPAS